MEISRLKNCLDQYFSLSGENSPCSFPTPNTEDREGAEQTKQDNKMMMFRKGLSRTFPFSAHALPAFRLSRKLLLDVDGVSDCAAGSDSAVLRTTAHATAHARRPTNTSPHILNGEHRMRVRTGLVLTQPCKQRLTPRLAPHVAPRARSIFIF